MPASPIHLTVAHTPTVFAFVVVAVIDMAMIMGVTRTFLMTVAHRLCQQFPQYQLELTRA